MADQNPKAQEDISEDELDQIIQDMSKDEETEKPAEKPALELVQGAKKKVAPVADQTIALELKGVVNLKLSFKNGDRAIEVLCSEDYLTCRMADGTEFKIPTGNAKTARKAA
jgi:hypothetical protein